MDAFLLQVTIMFFLWLLIPSTVYKTSNMVIGVEKVTVPGYLYKREIAIAQIK